VPFGRHLCNRADGAVTGATALVNHKAVVGLVMIRPAYPDRVRHPTAQREVALTSLHGVGGRYGKALKCCQDQQELGSWAP
jgi:hypothetical protein